MIRYIEPGIPPLSLPVGPQLSGMTDDESWLFITGAFAKRKAAADYRHIAMEVPLGSPQSPGTSGPSGVGGAGWRAALRH